MWPFWSSWQTRFHNYVLTEILLKKVRRRKFDSLGLVDRPDFHNHILIKYFAQKSATYKVWPFESSWQTRLSQLYMNRNFTQKSATFKVWPFESSWQTRLSQLYIWIEILLKKVRRRKCDPLCLIDRQTFTTIYE